MLEPPNIQHRGRRDYGHSFKMQVVHETLIPGASVSVVMRRRLTAPILRPPKAWATREEQQAPVRAAAPQEEKQRGKPRGIELRIGANSEVLTPSPSELGADVDGPRQRSDGAQAGGHMKSRPPGSGKREEGREVGTRHDWQPDERRLAHRRAQQVDKGS